MSDQGKRRRRPHGARPHARVSAPSKPRLALIGFRGVGKSAIARRLAEIWNIPMLSLDDQIERNAGMKIDQIVQTQGWPAFRDLEYAALQSAAASERLLLDCGGGIVEEADGLRSERKIALLRERFFCIYISVSEEKMRYRLSSLARNASRPDLTGADSPDKLLEVFRRREPLYLELAHTMVDVSDTNIGESALRITQMFK
jgi:shikimate kinase